MFTDTAAIVLALSASYVATLPASPRRTFGYHRAEIFAALVNAVVLLGVCGYLAVAGVRRLLDPVPVEAGLMLVFAAGGWRPTWSRWRCWRPGGASRSTCAAPSSRYWVTPSGRWPPSSRAWWC